MKATILEGNVFDRLKDIMPGSVDCCVTSPPYFALRSYLPKGHPLKHLELGSEPTVEAYIGRMVEVFQLVRDCMSPYGTCWINIGDSYRDGGNLALIPQRLAQALQEPYEQHRIKLERDRTWMAAMIDGEGTISIHQLRGANRDGTPCQDGYSPFVSVSNNDREILEQCAAIAGHGNIRVKQRAGDTDGRNIKSRRDNYAWRLDASKAVEVICDVYPYLVAKRKQAILAHTLACHNRDARKLRGWQQPLPQKEQEKRAYLKQLINACNQREPVDLPSWCVEPKTIVEPGWIVRSVIVFHKPSPMPASLAGWRWVRCRVKVKGVGNDADGWQRSPRTYDPAIGGQRYQGVQWENCPGCKKCQPNGGLVLRRGSWRPTSSWEPVLMLAKQAGYFADGEAVKQPAAYGYRHHSDRLISGTENGDGHRSGGGTVSGGGGPDAVANLRDVWRTSLADLTKEELIALIEQQADGSLPDVWTISSEPLHEKHYAAFPSRLVELCLRAGTSARGYCPACGLPWVRVVQQKPDTRMPYKTVGVGPYSEESGRDDGNKLNKVLRADGTGGDLAQIQTETLGWRPSCSHQDQEPRPGLVLDLFAGSGRTGLVARKLGLDFVGVELSPTYCEMARRLLSGDLPLFDDVPDDPEEPPPAQQSFDWTGVTE